MKRTFTFILLAAAIGAIGGTIHVTTLTSGTITSGAVATPPDEPAAAGAIFHAITNLGPIAYWPLTNTTGSTATDVMGLSDGTFTSTTLDAADFPGGDRAPYFTTNSRCNVYSTALTNAFPGSNGTLMLYCRMDTNIVDDGMDRYLVNFRSVDGASYINFLKSGSDYNWVLYYQAGGVQKALSRYLAFEDWIHFALVWRGTNDIARMYVNGREWISGTGLGTWGSTISSTYATIGARANTGLQPFRGNIAHVALWNRTLTQPEIASCLVTEFPDAKGLACIGDSKSDNDAWVQILAREMTRADGAKWVAREDLAIGARKAHEIAELLPMLMSPITQRVDCVTINLGANDATTPTDAQTFTNGMLSCINQAREQWPAAPIYVARIYRSDYAANCELLNGLIESCVTNTPGVYLGPDESVWCENGDGGTTMLMDGIHYRHDVHIQTICATQWVHSIFP